MESIKSEADTPVWLWEQCYTAYLLGARKVYVCSVTVTATWSFFIFFFFLERWEQKLWGGQRGGGRGEVWLTYFLLWLVHSEVSFFLIAVCCEVRRQITKTVILQEPLTNSFFPSPPNDTYYILLTPKVPSFWALQQDGKSGKTRHHWLTRQYRRTASVRTILGTVLRCTIAKN